jgi:hypothetical protein
MFPQQNTYTHRNIPCYSCPSDISRSTDVYLLLVCHIEELASRGTCGSLGGCSIIDSPPMCHDALVSHDRWLAGFKIPLKGEYEEFTRLSTNSFSIWVIV